MTTDEFNEKFAKTVSIVWTTFIVILVFTGIIYGAFSFGERRNFGSHRQRLLDSHGSEPWS
jgi:hypothetical protein